MSIRIVHQQFELLKNDWCKIRRDDFRENFDDQATPIINDDIARNLVQNN